jgi:hypothetical protein
MARLTKLFSLLGLLLLAEAVILITCAPVIRRGLLGVVQALAGLKDGGEGLRTVETFVIFTFRIVLIAFCYTLWRFLADGKFIDAAKIKAALKACVQAIPLQRLKNFCIVFFFIFVLLNGWQCDDAYHSHVMSRNLAEGFGLVYNVGERVSASTCPLWTLIVAFFLSILAVKYMDVFHAYFVERSVFNSGILYPAKLCLSPPA